MSIKFKLTEKDYIDAILHYANILAYQTVSPAELVFFKNAFKSNLDSLYLLRSDAAEKKAAKKYISRKK